MSYKIIWIDDEYEKQEAFLDFAFGEGIELFPFKISKKGMEELSANLWKYDGLILDAKVFNETEDEVAKLTGLQNAIYKLKELSAKREVPYVVFTGQKDLENNSTFDDMLPGVKVYKKGIDNARMLVELKIDINSLPETQLKSDYKEVFDVCTDQYIGEDCQKALLQILSSVKKPKDNFDDELYFTQIRIILESLFRKANKLGLLHNKCLLGGKVNLSESYLFLSGKPTRHLMVSCKINHFGKIISDSVDSILNISGAASHTVDADTKNNINLKEHRVKNNTPYLLYSLAFQLMDVLIWFKKYSDENSNEAENKLLWLPPEPIIGEWIKGEVIKIADNGYGTFKPSQGNSTLSILPKDINNFGLELGQKIEVTTTLRVGETGEKIVIKEIKKL